MKYLILFFLLFSISCDKNKDVIVQKKEISKHKNVFVDYQVKAFYDVQKENDSIIKRLEQCINSERMSGYRDYWDQADTNYFRTPYADLFSIVNFDHRTYKPTVIALQKLDSKYLVKIALLGKPENFNSLYVIYDVYAKKNNDNRYVFVNAINESLKNWQTKTVENISYYYNPNYNLIKSEIEDQISFENKLIKFLEVDKINYKFIICKNAYETRKILGYDYEDQMFFSDQYGGITFSAQKILFAGNNRAIYPHEVTHIYVYNNFPAIHPVVDEGIATYLGGSKGLSYKEHLEILQEFIENEKISLSDYLFDEEKRRTPIGQKSTIMYSCGALLCDMAYKKKGKQSLFKLMNSGKTNEKLKNTIEEIFQIKMKEFDGFLKNELKNYNYKEIKI